MADRGLCQWWGTPPDRQQQGQGQQTAMATNDPPVPTSPQTANTSTGMADPAFGGIVLLAVLGAAVWGFINKGKGGDADYDPHDDLDLALPPLLMHPPTTWESRQPYPIRSDGAINGPEMGAHSSEMGESSNPVVVVEDSPVGESGSPTWPPKGMRYIFDPLTPEQDGEFESFRQHVEKEGLNPRGNDILKLVWGITGGKSTKYAAGKKRRDEFAKRMEYYRYEGR
jgi:hypothetical protein